MAYKSKKQDRETLVRLRPATLADLTIGQLVHILNYIQLNPYKTSYYFMFGRDRFEVRVYLDNDETNDTDQS